MSTIAIIANGTLLKIGDGASTENFTVVPECMKLTGPAVNYDLLDATSHDSAGFFREFIPGLADGDNISIDVNWKPSNTVHKGLRVDSYARTRRNFKTVFPDATDNTVLTATYIKTITPKADIGTILAAAATLKVTGLPVWS